MSTAADIERGTAFTATRNLFESLLTWLEGEQAATLSHDALEDRLQVDARELIRQALQEHLDLRAESEPDRPSVIDAQQVPRPRTESGHSRALATVFGPVRAYSKRGRPNLHAADAALNLPVEKHSHGLRRFAAIESSRGSFDAAVDAIERATGHQLGKRQVEELAGRAAVDFDAFYLQRQAPTGQAGDVLVLSCDGKGVLMRPGSLRAATEKAAAHTNPKLATRLSVMATLRKLAIGILRLTGVTNIAAALRHLSRRPHRPLEILNTC